MGVIGGILQDLKELLAEGLSDLQRDIDNLNKPKESHPVTIQEAEDLAATIIFFESLKGMHNRMVANRQHEEMMDELQRIGRY